MLTRLLPLQRDSRVATYPAEDPPTTRVNAMTTRPSALSIKIDSRLPRRRPDPALTNEFHLRW
jgi:hypothetical protein